MIWGYALVIIADDRVAVIAIDDESISNINGVKSSQLDTVSYGKEKPSNDGHDEAAWSENRRVEITYKAGSPK